MIPENDSQTTRTLLDAVRNGDVQALNLLLARHRPEMRRMVELRMGPQLRRRADPSDIIQEAKGEASRRLPDYLEHPVLPFRLWLRRLTHDQLVMMRRRHLHAQRRAVGRELPLPHRSSVDLARRLLDPGPTPSEQVVAAELAQRLRAALALLPENDQEILLMRNFEHLSNQEAAQVLGIEPVAASKRYGRAVLRLRRILLDGGMAESGP
jgi:RNA polymerase sigma-70 factor, ECF subfamily